MTTTLAYLLIGQSNMFGVAPWPLPDPADPDLLVLAPGETAFRPALEPLHGHLYPGQPGQGGMGPGKPFGARLRERFPSLRIVLLACARPSTIAGLVPGQPAYDECVSTIQQAGTLGAIPGGIVCHHGEADTSDVARAEAWDAEYVRFVTQYRGDVGVPDLPSVHAQLGLCSLPGVTTWDLVKHHQSLVPAQLSRSAMVRTDDFFDLSFDRLHSSPANNVEEGKRLADAMVALGHSSFPTAASVPLLTAETTVAGVTVRTSTFMVKVEVGTLVNASLAVESTGVASGATYIVQPPYPQQLRIRAAQIAPGPWSAPFTVHDGVYVERFVLGRGGQPV